MKAYTYNDRLVGVGNDQILGTDQGGGTANAFTLDYVNPNQYCYFGNNPDCSRPNVTVTPQYTLTNNYILDNLTLNGTNIQGTSFTMPSIDSVVGMVVHQITPLILKFSTPIQTYGGFELWQLQVNYSTPGVFRAYKEYSGGQVEEFSSVDLASLNNGNHVNMGLSYSSVYILMNAVSTDVISFNAANGFGGPFPAQIIYDNQVIHSANLDISSSSYTFVNLVHQ